MIRTESVGVYEGAVLVEVYEASPRVAWDCAARAVRYMARAGGEWGQTPGRVNYTAGRYRAVRMVRS
jgi:hypothetical protein